MRAGIRLRDTARLRRGRRRGEGRVWGFRGQPFLSRWRPGRWRRIKRRQLARERMLKMEIESRFISRLKR